MRKVSLILAVLLFATPAWAGVVISCAQVPDTNEVVVSYTVTGEPNKVRAFALDIILDNDANITEVNSVANVDYTIFPGSIAIDDGEITDEGTPVGDPCDYSEDSQPGLDSNGVTIEMGALYSPPNDDSPNAPPDANVLLSFFVNKSCCVTITLNEARGGIVLTDPDEEIDSFAAPGVGATPCYPVVYYPECFPLSDPCYAQQAADYLQYKQYNAVPLRVQCWCADDPVNCTTPPCVFQCDGDADGATYGSKKYRVYTPDFGLLVANWKKKISDPTIDPCADFDHKGYGSKKYRVYTPDFGLLVTNWKKKDTDLPGDCPRPD